MTGMMVRVERDGRWQSIEVDRLSDAELNEWLRLQREREPFDGWAWARSLIVWIRDNVKAENLGAAARVDQYIRKVDEGLRSLPDRFQGEARLKLMEVIAEAMPAIDADAERHPLPRPGGDRGEGLLPGPGRDGH